MTNLDSILKSRDITLPTKAHLVKAVVFPVVMYGCETPESIKDLSISIDKGEVNPLGGLGRRKKGTQRIQITTRKWLEETKYTSWSQMV